MAGLDSEEGNLVVAAAMANTANIKVTIIIIVMMMVMMMMMMAILMSNTTNAM